MKRKLKERGMQLVEITAARLQIKSGTFLQSAAASGAKKEFKNLFQAERSPFHSAGLENEMFNRLDCLNQSCFCFFKSQMSRHRDVIANPCSIHSKSLDCFKIVIVEL